MADNYSKNYLVNFEFKKEAADSNHLEDCCSDSANLTADSGISSYY
jgi:hypothetical protein